MYYLYLALFLTVIILFFIFRNQAATRTNAQAVDYLKEEYKKNFKSLYMINRNNLNESFFDTNSIDLDAIFYVKAKLASAKEINLEISCESIRFEDEFEEKSICDLINSLLNIGIMLVEKRSEKTVKLHFYENEGKKIIEMTDTGKQIAKAIFDNANEKIYKYTTPNSIETNFIIVNQIVKDLNGQFLINKSETGNGIRITL